MSYTMYKTNKQNNTVTNLLVLFSVNMYFFS